LARVACEALARECRMDGKSFVPVDLFDKVRGFKFQFQNSHTYLMKSCTSLLSCCDFDRIVHCCC
jgi:hypothetical protein